MASSPPPEVTISTGLNVPVRVPGSSRMCVPPLINTGAGLCRSVFGMVGLGALSRLPL
jgi:hypothetical protein